MFNGEYLALLFNTNKKIDILLFRLSALYPQPLGTKNIWTFIFISQIEEEGFRFQKRYKTWKLVEF